MKIQIRIFIIGFCIIILSFIPELIPSFFGDWLCEGSGEFIKTEFGGHYEKCNHASIGFHHPKWHWGYRHYIWMILGLTLAIINIVQVIIDSEKK